MKFLRQLFSRPHLNGSFQSYNNLSYALQSILSESLGIIVSGLLYESFNVSTFIGYEMPLCSITPYDEVQYVFW